MNIRILSGTAASVTKSANSLIGENPNWTPAAFTANGGKVSLAMNLGTGNTRRVAEVAIMSGTPAALEKKLTELVNPSWSITSIATTAAAAKKAARGEGTESEGGQTFLLLSLIP